MGLCDLQRKSDYDPAACHETRSEPFSCLLVTPNILPVPPIVIGIPGCTRLGKSRLASALAEQLGSKAWQFSLAAKHKSGWEATESINHERMRHKFCLLVSRKPQPKFTIIEDVRAFHDVETVAAMHVLVCRTCITCILVR